MTKALQDFVASLDKAHHIALQRSKQFNTAEGASEARSAANGFSIQLQSTMMS